MKLSKPDLIPSSCFSRLPDKVQIGFDRMFRRKAAGTVHLSAHLYLKRTLINPSPSEQLARPVVPGSPRMIQCEQGLL
jgi:hypothetical protein